MWARQKCLLFGQPVADRPGESLLRGIPPQRGKQTVDYCSRPFDELCIGGESRTPTYLAHILRTRSRLLDFGTDFDLDLGLVVLPDCFFAASPPGVVCKPRGPAMSENTSVL